MPTRVTRFVPGQEIWIPCESDAGAFPDEAFVTIETTAGPISGFVRGSNLRADDGSGTARLRAIVKDVSDTTLTVWPQGPAIAAYQLWSFGFVLVATDSPIRISPIH